MLSVLVFDLTDPMGAVVYIIIDLGHIVSSFCRGHYGFYSYYNKRDSFISKAVFTKNSGGEIW